MALSKPGFYFLAKCGPWDFHVRLKSMNDAFKAKEWLTEQGKLFGTHYEVIEAEITNAKGGTQTYTDARNRTVIAPRPIFFFNDSSLASYVKLTWG